MLVPAGKNSVLPTNIASLATHHLFAPLRDADQETCLVAYLAMDGTLLGSRKVRGAKTWVEMPVREVALDALRLGADQVVLAHNHPSGDPRPSDGDLRYTRRLARGLGALDVLLFDHLVIAGGQVTSMRQEGLL